jgi:uncharacterized membrane protein
LSSLIILLMAAGFLALIADTAHLQYARQRAQTAADAAAITALYEVEHGNSFGMRRAAELDAARNGVAGESATVEINYPPLSGEYASDLKAVEARISNPAPGFLARILRLNPGVAGARAVAIRAASGRVVLAE